MRFFEFARAMIFAIPLGIFTTITALLFVINAMKARRLKTNHNKVFFFYLPAATLTSALFLAYYYFPDFFRQVDIFYCGSLVFTIILFHHFHCITISPDKHFSLLHYVTPTIVFCFLVLSKLYFPQILADLNYTLLFSIILIFSVFYFILGLYEIHLFYIKQSITFGSTEVINHSRVVLLMLEKLMFPVVFGLLPFIGGRHPGTLVSIFLMVAILAALYNNIPLVYSIIRYVTLNDLSRSLFDAIQIRRQIDESNSGHGEICQTLN